MRRSELEPAVRGVSTLTPEECFRLAMEALDLGWELGLAGELQAGAANRGEAEARLAERWRREDEARLRMKLARWKALERARG